MHNKNRPCGNRDGRNRLQSKLQANNRQVKKPAEIKVKLKLDIKFEFFSKLFS